jgi:hypothetical protein
MRRFAICFLVLILLSNFLFAQTGKPPVKPGKIFVGSMGSGDDAEQLRLALGFELANSGFKVVDFEQQSNTVLSGLIATRMDDGKPVMRATVFLKDRTGKMLWNQDFGAASTSSKSNDTVRQRAREIAQRLKRDAAPKKTPPARSLSH